MLTVGQHRTTPHKTRAPTWLRDALELPGRPARGRCRVSDAVRIAVGARDPFRAARSRWSRRCRAIYLARPLACGGSVGYGMGCFPHFERVLGASQDCHTVDIHSPTVLSTFPETSVVSGQSFEPRPS